MQHTNENFTIYHGVDMRVIFLFLLSLLSCGGLTAAVEDHFRKIQDKTGYHQMRNIDFIYMINLDERPEKYDACVKQLHPYGIYPYRFSAVNGWKLSVETINDVGVVYQPGMMSDMTGTYYPSDTGMPAHEPIQVFGRNYFCFDMPRGAIGIVLSHLSILQDAYDAGYEAIWVMEDDIEVIQNPHMLSDMIDRLDVLVGKDGWDVLFTDKDTKGQDGVEVICLSYLPRPNFQPADPERFAIRLDVSQDFRKVGARYGAYSMILRRSGIEKILSFVKKYKIFLPYDMEYCLPDDIRFYTVLQNVVSTQPKAASDNGKPGYLQEMHSKQ